MAQTSGTYDSYDTAGKKQDIADAIYMVDPWDTPFVKLCDKVSAKNKQVFWQTQALAAASDNKQIEGDAVGTFDTRTPTVEVSNLTQISWNTVAISGTTEAIDHAGRASEIALQKLNMGKELRKCMEVTLMSNKPKVAGDSSTARELAGLGAWITTNDVFNGTNGGIAVGTSDGTSPTAADGTDARGDATSQAGLDEEYVWTAQQRAYSSGGTPGHYFVGPFNMRQVANFTGNATKFVDAEANKVVNSVKIIEGPLGMLNVVCCRQQRERDSFMLDMSLWAIATLRPIFWKPIAPVGDHERGMLITEFTLVARNEKGSSGVFDLTTS